MEAAKRKNLRRFRAIADFHFIAKCHTSYQGTEGAMPFCTETLPTVRHDNPLHTLVSNN